MAIRDKDRIVGCLLGGALGDALGGTYEGLATPVEIQVPEVLRISDDTQLTLATCEAIMLADGVEPSALADRFLLWFRERRLSGLGSSTLKALRDLDVGAHWALSGARGEYAAGNGAAMRAAPLAFVLDPTDEVDRRILRDVCRITHQHDEAYLGALALVTALRHLASGQVDEGGNQSHVRQLDERLPRVVLQQLPDSRMRDRLSELSDAHGSQALSELAARYGASGYVVDTVPLAILGAAEHDVNALEQQNSFVRSLHKVIACGGDTDTLASMTGQLLGAAMGTSAIPVELIDRLDERQQVLKVAEQFAAFVAAR